MRVVAREGPRVVLAVLGVAVVVWLVIKAAQGGSTFLQVTLNGITLAALYFVVAAGFTLIFGLMRVVNMAHGSLYLFGGYLAYVAQTHWYSGGTSQFQLGPTNNIGVMGFFVPLVFATFVIGLVGLGIQQLFLRWNQGQDLRQALITIAISVIFADQMIAHYGGVVESIQAPTSWPSSILIGSFRYPFFRVVVVLGAALLIGLLLFLLIRRTLFGMIVRAGVDDRAMLSALGVNVQLVFAGAFFIGAMLAGLAGVLGGTMISVGPGLDTQFLLDALIVVIIGGMGSLPGAAIGALALGLVQSYSTIYLHFGSVNLTNYGILASFVLVIAVLAVRPLGLFGRPA
ncbi:MAG: branched-chain amino acid ABC transporter permease [Solirubrobacterales bacterium]|nr:branched-chain amino acid ABC transporter permease [Solirubrobacterales bacterium]MBV9365916.1 branched-chain amino acid ABC transporter permease [Solirubrobacterales bacterium]MBV9807598.1 branched-chain amino acid ABC transporter permease [Solirubrobacterales bacterium]